MSNRCLKPAVVLFLLAAHSPSPAQPEGDPERGARLFGRACAACHSLEPGRHMTGPSLAGVWGRRAGAAQGFGRYSEVLEAADLVWDEDTLDPWLEDPAGFLPGNRMAFRGIGDARARADLIAFLEAANAGEAPPGDGARGGMMGAPRLLDLKELGPEQQVSDIAYCGDTYRVTTATGRTLEFWEFNLRFKTDSSAQGPDQGRPVLLRAGMMGDRAFVVFADPREISPAIRHAC